jgi:hypothetical protein
MLNMEDFLRNNPQRLQEQIRESLEAGRISAEEEKAIQKIIGQYGIDAGLHVLQRFEHLNSISAYIEAKGPGFKMREFYYYPHLPEAEKQKITLALQEALHIMKRDRRLEGCQ